MDRGRDRAALDRDRQFSLAMTRLLEIVGEATARISQETRERLARIPWSQVVGLRNRLIHGYDEVDFDVIWSTVGKDLPVLISHLESNLRDSCNRSNSSTDGTASS